MEVRMAGLTWIHLSDWHQGSKEFNRKVILDALVDDLRTRTSISADLSTIDFIVFSGDVAYGGKPEEYEAAKEDFFARLLEASGLGPERLFIVAGNHDLNMDDLELLPSALLKPLESDQEIQNWIVEERHRWLALQPFYEFVRFVTDYTNQKKPDFASINRFVIDGKKIALLGLNSAWMCVVIMMQMVRSMMMGTF
jgi:DNA repair exonuclease SbcCD nuclease subunit